MLAATVVAGSMLAGGAIGVAVLGPHLAGAQSTTTTPPATGNGQGTQPGSTFKGNEDPAHEAAETPQREADEDAGRGFRHHGGHGGPSNEDPAHEAAETPEQEAAENARQAPPSGSPSTTVASSPGQAQ